MKAILLLTNFTETSARALERFMLVFAPKLAGSCKFILLNAWLQRRSGRFQMMNIDGYLEEVSLLELEREKKRLQGLIPGLKVKIETESKKGDIAAVLNLYCEKKKPDMIVMGTKGSSLLRELVAGSTTGNIVRKLKLPMLVIPESADFSYPHRIVMATEMKECTNESDFERLTEIVRMFASEFIILHIYKEDKPPTAEFEKCMKKHLEGINYEFQYVPHINVAEAISEFSVNMKANLLSMVCHNENLLVKLFKHSVSTKLTQRAELPMLIIHEG